MDGGECLLLASAVPFQNEAMLQHLRQCPKYTQILYVILEPKIA